MVGIIIFWLSYIVSAVLLYTILFGSYKKRRIEKTSKTGWTSYEYEETNERKKHPLWMILLFIIVFFLPVINLVVLGGHIVISSEDSTSLVYFKSFLTKEY